MRRRLSILLFTAAIGAAVTLHADSHVAVSLEDRARGAEQVVRGRVLDVSSAFQRNEFGDNLIVSTVRLGVGEVLKGQGGMTLDILVEGGSVGELTLRVSDQPVLQSGDEGVFFLVRNRSGALVPYLRGQGFLRLDAAGRVSGTTTSYESLRQAVLTSLPVAR